MAVEDFELKVQENYDLCDKSLSQFYTPPELAERIVEWALGFCTFRPLRVLEPSCGRGALLVPLLARGCEVVGVDIDSANISHCRDAYAGAFICGDFTKLTKIDLHIHLVVMNSPFEEGQAEQHILHALKFAPRVVAHVPLTTLAGKDRRDGLWSIAYLKRLVIHATRPKYSGSRTGGMTDMCTIDVVRRPESPMGTVAASGVNVEWWA